jgi:7,8-dihydropterin-6-yl-methyl-4-(beta-D-ribofuranosyl)aminobenzene 5'-phosphate synthase
MTIQEIYRCFWSGKNEPTTRVKKPESFGAGVGRALRRAAKAARKAAYVRHADLRFGARKGRGEQALILSIFEAESGAILEINIGEAPGTKELKELSLAINTADGIVLVVGCSHPGIESIVAEAAKINPHIHFIAGGFHLVAAQDPAIEKIATTLYDTYKVDYIAPGHCTGEPTFAALQKTFDDHYLYAGLGTTLNLGANPRAASHRRAGGVLDEDDLRSYRTLLAQSDDLSDGGSEIVHLAQTK